MTTVAALTDPKPCDSCAAKGVQAMIILVLVDNNAARRPLKHMPLNAVPDPGGNVAVRVEHTGALRGRVLARGQKPAGGETVFCPHFVTCKDPAWHRRKRDKGRTAVQPGGRPKRPAPTPLPGM